MDGAFLVDSFSQEVTESGSWDYCTTSVGYYWTFDSALAVARKNASMAEVNKPFVSWSLLPITNAFSKPYQSLQVGEDCMLLPFVKTAKTCSAVEHGWALAAQLLRKK